MFDLDRLVDECRAALAAERGGGRAVREVVARAVCDPTDLMRALGEPRGSGKNLGRYAASWIACWPKRPSSTAART